jgi:hypothetical protein
MQTNEEQWASQVKSVISSPNALLKLVGVSVLWQIIGFGLAFINFGIFLVFIVVFFGVLWLFPYWQPAYSIIYHIAGNKNISPILENHKLKWWQFISLGIRLLFLALLLYYSIKLFAQ